MLVLFVGDKPSSKNTDPNMAFLGTKSGETLEKWIRHMNVDWFRTINQVDAEFEDNVLDAVNNLYPVIALGNNAQAALINLMNKNALVKFRSYLFYTLPHPSGRNRKLNDKKYVEETLKECKNHIDHVRSLE